MKRNVLTICAILFSMFIATGQSTTEHKLKLTLGAIDNADHLFGSRGVSIGAQIQADYQIQMASNVYAGLKAQFFTLEAINFFLISPGIYSNLLTRERTNVIVSTHIGYAISDNEVESGTKWGGVNIGIGVENNYAFGEKRNMEIGIAINYSLQEMKYRTFLGTTGSRMEPALGAGLSLTKRLGG